MTPERILTDLRNTLLELHKILIDSERAAYERDIEKIRTPGQMLGLLIDDPWFAWLRDLSRLVVTIDERLDDKENPVTADDAKVLVARARALLTPAEHGNGFERRYFEAMQRDPAVVLGHAATSRIINGLRAA
jgi:hypothetical protein